MCFHYFQSHILPKKPVQLLVQTGLKWQRDDCGNLAAALAFHGLFSLFPILLAILSVLGALLGPNTLVLQSLQSIAERYLPTHVHPLIADTLATLHTNSFGAGVLGFGLLLYSASNLFAVLTGAVNKIWHVHEFQPAPQSLQRVILNFVLNRIWALVWVFGVVALLLVSLLSSILIRLLLKWVAQVPQLNLFETAQVLQVLASLLILTIVMSLLLKRLPATRVYWRDVGLAGGLTALLLVFLQQLISNSVLVIGGGYLSYGVIGNVMILLLWIYFTCQIFLGGCVFSYVYAHLYGSRQQKSR